MLSYVEVGMLLALVASADLVTTVMLIQLVREVIEMATWLSVCLQGQEWRSPSGVGGTRGSSYRVRSISPSLPRGCGGSTPPPPPA